MKKEGLSQNLLWLGMVVVAAGITLGFLGADYRFWSILGMLGGCLLILVYVVLNFADVREFFLAYATRQWVNMALFILLMLGIIIVVQMIANNHNYRFDLTSEGKMSVAPLTKQLLQKVGVPVNVVGFYQEEEREKLEGILELYRLASERFTYELHNLDHNPGLAKKYRITSYGSAVVEVGGKSKVIKYPSEEALINAVVNLTSPRQKIVYFLTGHGEYEPKGVEADCVCYGMVKSALESENFEVRTFLFAGGKSIPADADVVVCGGSQGDFRQEELAALGEYLRRGGSLILAVDPGERENLSSFLNEYGIALGNDIVIDPEDYLIEKNPLVPLVPFYFSHPITEGFTIPAVMALSRSVGASTNAPTNISVQSLARSSEKSWAESDVAGAERDRYSYDPGFDRKGPVTVAAVSEITVAAETGKGVEQPASTSAPEAKPEPAPKGKMVVFGDADFLLNWYFDQLGNKDLFLNTVHWMTEAESLISIRRKKPSAEDLQPVYLEPMHARLIFISIVILQPVALLTAGLVVAWRRRRKG